MGPVLFLCSLYHRDSFKVADHYFKIMISVQEAVSITWVIKISFIVCIPMCKDTEFRKWI